MIAVLASRVEQALTHLNSMRCVEEFDKVTNKGVFTSGRKFLVVTEPKALQGLRLSDYILAGAVGDELISVARGRMQV